MRLVIFQLYATTRVLLIWRIEILINFNLINIQFETCNNIVQTDLWNPKNSRLHSQPTLRTSTCPDPVDSSVESATIEGFIRRRVRRLRTNVQFHRRMSPRRRCVPARRRNMALTSYTASFNTSLRCSPLRFPCPP